MSGRNNVPKNLLGHQYSIVVKDRINKGGNGAVYNAHIESRDVTSDVAVKIFMPSSYSEERYYRFESEIKDVRKFNEHNINGIMPIFDWNIPAYKDVSDGQDYAWYLMPKAREFKIKNGKNLVEKLHDMRELAEILRKLHEIGYAHRDIKPENILILNNQIVLSDFGLIWHEGDPRYTVYSERMGPMKIMPPEFEKMQPDLQLDYRKSDVYLWGKVLWMAIKEDTNGFRGVYDRKDSQRYINKRNYENVSTFEPIHKMLESITAENMNDRMSISECIDCVDEQIALLSDSVHFDTYKLQHLIYEENCREIIESNIPDEVSYTDHIVIMKMIVGLIRNAEISIDNNLFTQKIQVAVAHDDSEGYIYCDSYADGRKVCEYVFKVNKMICSNKNDAVTLMIDKIDEERMQGRGYIKYGGRNQAYGLKRYYLTENQSISLYKAGEPKERSCNDSEILNEYREIS